MDGLIVKHDSQLLAAAESLPIHVMSGPDMTAVVMRELGRGACAVQYQSDTSGPLTELDPVRRVTLNDGEAIVSESCGGGGYGLPAERDPERVRRDVIEGWISRDRAEQAYLVVLDEDDQVDERWTHQRRTAFTNASAADNVESR